MIGEGEKYGGFSRVIIYLMNYQQHLTPNVVGVPLELIGVSGVTDATFTPVTPLLLYCYSNALWSWVSLIIGHLDAYSTRKPISALPPPRKSRSYKLGVFYEQASL